MNIYSYTVDIFPVVHRQVPPLKGQHPCQKRTYNNLCYLIHYLNTIIYTFKIVLFKSRWTLPARPSLLIYSIVICFGLNTDCVVYYEASMLIYTKCRSRRQKNSFINLCLRSLVTSNWVVSFIYIYMSLYVHVHVL